MFTINELQHYSLPSISYIAAVNDSLQIYTMTNSTREFIKQKQVDDGHSMAYSAYTNRAKRAAVEHQYSEADCHNASEELSLLVNLAVFHPSSWYQHKSRIESLQSITKSADCQEIKCRQRISGHK